MRYEIRGRDILIPRDFSLGATFDCGQCFRFEKDDAGRWHGIAFGKELFLYEEDGAIVLENTGEEDFLSLWAEYFDLCYDYDSFYGKVCADPVLKKIVRSCAPSPSDCLHILRQDPWETLCSFLISQNNNIPRIRKIIRTLCKRCGKRIGENAFAFPEPGALASLSEEELRAAGCGYRAAYLADAARRVSDGTVDLRKIREMDSPRQRDALRRIRGVGPKVAECVLLYGFHRMEAFPADVWILRAMERFFPGEGPQKFGAHAGLAQQYLYAYSRLHPEFFREQERGVSGTGSRNDLDFSTRR